MTNKLNRTTDSFEKDVDTTTQEEETMLITVTKDDDEARKWRMQNDEAHQNIKSIETIRIHPMRPTVEVLLKGAQCSSKEPTAKGN